MNIKEAIKFPFVHPGAREKITLLFVLTMVTTLTGGLFSLMTQLPLETLQSFINKGMVTESLRTYVYTGHALSGILEAFLQIALIPIYLYISGYLFQLTRNIMYSEKDPLEQHSEVLDKMKLGLKKWLLELPVQILFALSIFIPAMAYLFTLFSISGFSTPQTTQSPVILIVLTILFILFFLFLILVFPLIISSVLFNYLNGEGYIGSFSPTKIWKVIRIGWFQFYTIIFTTMGLAIFAFILNILLLCVSFITYPLSIVIMQIIISHLYGQAFRNIKKILG